MIKNVATNIYYIKKIIDGVKSSKMLVKNVATLKNVHIVHFSILLYSVLEFYFVHSSFHQYVSNLELIISWESD